MSWVTSFCLGPLDSVPLDEGKAFVAGGLSLAVFRRRDGTVYAMEAPALHREGLLAEELDHSASIYSVWEAGGMLYVTVEGN